MERLNRSAVLALAVMLGAGCVQKAAPTVEYFRANRDERGLQLEHCTNEAGQSRRDPACVNAREAERLESIGNLRDLPPSGLTPLQPSTQDEEQSSKQQD
jgi:hypothetical protein